MVSFANDITSRDIQSHNSNIFKNSHPNTTRQFTQDGSIEYPQSDGAQGGQGEDRSAGRQVEIAKVGECEVFNDYGSVDKPSFDYS